ncbi:MAG: hypothetical protein JJ858_07330 [Rhizobiaceae bacterium]|nr:hypothetical protein [Rhizobiaceae bacterium]
MSLFLKAITQIFSNWKMAIRVSLPLAVVLAFIMATGSSIFQDFDPTNLQIFSIQNTAIILLSSVIFWVFSCSTAVAWHRYILLGEQPHGFVIVGKRDRILPYLIGTLIVTLFSILVALILTFGFGILGSIFVGVLPSEIGLVLSLLVSLIGGAIFYTFILALSVSLPGIAMDNPLGIQGAIDATVPYYSKIFVVMLLIQACNVVLGVIPSVLIAGQSSITDISFILITIVNVIFYWFSAMLGIGILTVIYGFAVEGRDV